MSQDYMHYHEMMERALKGVMRQALERAVAGPLPGNHHFYISFLTGHPDVEIAPFLHERYPDEMTIVLQHQFWGLAVDDQGFRVTLSFSGTQEELVIPYDAVTGFADPSVQFGLRFQADEMYEDGEAPSEATADEDNAAAAPEPDDEAETRGEVVALDSFRKK